MFEIKTGKSHLFSSAWRPHSQLLTDQFLSKLAFQNSTNFLRDLFKPHSFFWLVFGQTHSFFSFADQALRRGKEVER
jgi:hypothetical protein